STITDANAHWFPNAWVGKNVQIQGRTFPITSNTTNTLYVSGQFYPAQNQFFQILSPVSAQRSVEVVQSIDTGSFTYGYDHHNNPLVPQTFTWLESYRNIAAGPYGPMLPIVATGPGFDTELASGSTTGDNTPTTLNDTTQNWVLNAYAGDLVVI